MTPSWPRYDVEDIPCSEPECAETVKNHYWGRTKSGWFFQKTGEAWCPAHFPDWVESWRARKAEKLSSERCRKD